MRNLKIILALTVVTVVAASILIVYWAIYPYSSPDWTGFGPYDEKTHGSRAKTLWDWLDLLIVPLFIAFAAWLLSTKEKDIERKVQLTRQHQETLEKYFDRMSELLLSRGLQNSMVGSEVRSLARNWSLAVCRTLDGSRKAEVLQFLYESDLIDKNPILVLNGANLRSCRLNQAVLVGAEIKGAYFNGATMRGANLRCANFCGSDLRNVDLRNAILEETDLSFAFLNGANLAFNDLRKTILKGADLTGANLWGSLLTEEQREIVVISKVQSAILKLSGLLRTFKQNYF